jgi:hypothetical protein
LDGWDNIGSAMQVGKSAMTKDRFHVHDSLDVTSSVMLRPDHRRIEIVEPEMAAILRGKSTSQRTMMMLDANQTMRLLIAGRLRTENAALTPSLIDSEVARRVLHASLHSG